MDILLADIILFDVKEEYGSIIKLVNGRDATISLKKSRREEQKRFHGMRPSDHCNQRQQ